MSEKKAVKPAKGQRWRQFACWGESIVVLTGERIIDGVVAGFDYFHEGTPSQTGWDRLGAFGRGGDRYRLEFVSGPRLPDEPVVAVPVGGGTGARPTPRPGQRWRLDRTANLGWQGRVLTLREYDARRAIWRTTDGSQFTAARFDSGDFTLIADAPAEKADARREHFERTGHDGISCCYGSCSNPPPKADAAALGITVTVDASMQPGTFRIEAYREPPPPPPAPRYEVSHNGRDVLAYERLGNAETPADDPQSFPYWRRAGESAWDARCSALVAARQDVDFARHAFDDNRTALRMKLDRKTTLAPASDEPWRPSCDELHLCEDA